MSLERHRIAIEGEYMSAMSLYDSNISIVGENPDFTPPSNKPWIRMSLTELDNKETCINSSRQQTDGIFNVQIFTPAAQGAGEASKIVDESRRILRSANLNAISFLSSDVDSGKQEDGWFYLLLRTRYRALD